MAYRRKRRYRWRRSGFRVRGRAYASYTGSRFNNTQGKYKNVAGQLIYCNRFEKKYFDHVIPETAITTCIGAGAHGVIIDNKFALPDHGNSGQQQSGERYVVHKIQLQLRLRDKSGSGTFAPSLTPLEDEIILAIVLKRNNGGGAPTAAETHQLCFIDTDVAATGVLTVQVFRNLDYLTNYAVLMKKYYRLGCQWQMIYGAGPAVYHNYRNNRDIFIKKTLKCYIPFRTTALGVSTVANLTQNCAYIWAGSMNANWVIGGISRTRFTDI